MNKKEFLDIFDTYNDEHCKFELVADKFSSRSDLHAFILLDKIQPKSRDMISASKHDIIYLDIDIDEVLEVITKEQVIDLIRCGVMYDSDDCFSMFT
jgi:hypothetical protein